MTTYIEDLVQNIYTNCDMKGLNDLNDGLQKAVGYTKELDDRLRSAHQAQKQGFDFHARAINASKEAYKVESLRERLEHQRESYRLKRNEMQQKWDDARARRQKREIERVSKLNGLYRTLGRWILAAVSIRTVKGIIDTGSRLQLVQKSIEGLTKSTQDWDYIQKQAFKTGTDVEVVARGYRNFYSSASMAGFDKGNIQGMYADLLLSTRAIGANTQQTEGALLALEQMISKGKVSMEELRRQLGNAIPGAFEIAAKAMNMTTAQLNDFVRTGNLSSVEFVPKFISQLKNEYANGFKEISQTVDFATKNLINTWKLFTAEFMSGKSGKAFAQLINEVTAKLNSPAFKLFIQILSDSFVLVVKILTFAIEHLRIVGLILGSAGLYRWLLLHHGLWKLIHQEIKLTTLQTAVMGRTGIKAFIGMRNAATGFLSVLFKILLPLMLIEDVIVGLGQRFLGWNASSLTGDYLMALKDKSDAESVTAFDMLNIPEAMRDKINGNPAVRKALDKALASDNPKDKELAKYIMTHGTLQGRPGLSPSISATPRPKANPWVVPTLTGPAAPISGMYEPYTTPDIIPSGLPIGGAASIGGMLNKEQEITTSVNIGDINVYSNASNPQQVAQEVQEQLIALFMGQGLITDVGEYT